MTSTAATGCWGLTRPGTVIATALDSAECAYLGMPSAEQSDEQHQEPARPWLVAVRDDPGQLALASPTSYCS
jgi:hypothetical protein